MAFTAHLLRPLVLVLSTWVISLCAGLPNVSAEWVLVDGNEKANVYVDPETMQRRGALVILWVLDDLQTAHMRGSERYLSSRAQEEHDCKERRFRVRMVMNFSGHMGSGQEIYQTSTISRWTPIPPGTLARSVWVYACSTGK